MAKEMRMGETAIIAKKRLSVLISYPSDQILFPEDYDSKLFLAINIILPAKDLKKQLVKTKYLTLSDG